MMYTSLSVKFGITLVSLIATLGVLCKEKHQHCTV